MSLAKKPSTALSQEALVGVKWNVQRGCRASHRRTIVVDDGMDRLSLRHLRLDGLEKADELLMAVALHVAADDGAFEHVTVSASAKYQSQSTTEVPVRVRDQSEGPRFNPGTLILRFCALRLRDRGSRGSRFATRRRTLALRAQLVTQLPSGEKIVAKPSRAHLRPVTMGAIALAHGEDSVRNAAAVMESFCPDNRRLAGHSL